MLIRFSMYNQRTTSIVRPCLIFVSAAPGRAVCSYGAAIGKCVLPDC